MSRPVRSQRGFTLVEIMIVVLIFAMLMSIVMLQVSHARTQGQNTTCMGNLRQIETAKEEWALQTKQAATATPQSTDLVPAFMKTYPACPSGGTYTIGALSARPTCSTTGHALP